MQFQYMIFTAIVVPSLESHMQIPGDICPVDLSDCLLGDDQALKCYQSVEKLRVRYG